MWPICYGVAVVVHQRQHSLDPHCVNKTAAKIAAGSVPGAKSGNPVAGSCHAADTRFANR